MREWHFGDGSLVAAERIRARTFSETRPPLPAISVWRCVAVENAVEVARPVGEKGMNSGPTPSLLSLRDLARMDSCSEKYRKWGKLSFPRMEIIPRGVFEFPDFRGHMCMYQTKNDRRMSVRRNWEESSPFARFAGRYLQARTGARGAVRLRQTQKDGAIGGILSEYIPRR